MGRKKIVLNPKEVERLASRGLGTTQIATAMGVSWETVNKNRKRHKEFEAAYQRGVAKGIADVANSLYEQSMKGNVVASIFYLKNRDEVRWKDRVETTTNHSINLNTVLSSAKKRLIDVTPELKRLEKDE
jgi:orotate phosphoribosyltransferase-like protein